MSDKCEKVDGKVIHCDDFKEMIKQYGEGSEIERNIRIDKATGTFNRCPFCMEWIGV